MCIDIVEDLFGIANEQISSILTDLYVLHTVFSGYYRFACLSKIYIRVTDEA